MRPFDLADRHFDLLDGRERFALEKTLEAVKGLGIEYALAGGWAVYTYVPAIPSVDVDLYVHEDEALRAALARHGIAAGAGEIVEPIRWTDRVEIWGTQIPGLELADPSFRVADLLSGRVLQATLRIGGKDHDVQVPDPVALCVTKLVALHNRALAYRSYMDGEAGMLLGPSLQPMLQSKGQDYWLRKAGKDSYDLGALLARPVAPDDVCRLLDALGFGAASADLLHSLPGVVLEMGRSLARRVEHGDPVLHIEALRDALQALS